MKIQTILCIVALFICAIVFAASAGPPGNSASVDVPTSNVVTAAAPTDIQPGAEQSTTNESASIGYPERTTYSPPIAYAEVVIRIPEAPTIGINKPPIATSVEDFATRASTGPEQVLTL